MAEGIRLVSEMKKEDLIGVYVSESWWRTHQRLADKMEPAPEILSDCVFAHVSDTKTPQGIMGVVRRRVYGFADVTGETQKKQAHIVILSNLQDPGNVGTIFRTAEAAGVTGIILSRDCVDVYNPKVVRSTMGAILRVPFYYTDDLPGEIKRIRKERIKVYAADLVDSRDYDQEDYIHGSAFLIGNEGNGLEREIADLADSRIRIPMQGEIESLNAAVAASILMFEASRQRRGRKDLGD